MSIGSDTKPSAQSPFGIGANNEPGFVVSAILLPSVHFKGNKKPAIGG
jgi:hypothetical protein